MYGKIWDLVWSRLKHKDKGVCFWLAKGIFMSLICILSTKQNTHLIPNQYIGILKQWIINSYQFVIFCDRRYLAIWWWRNQCWFDSLKSKGFCFEHESGWCMLNFKYQFLFWAISKLIPIFCKDKLSISHLMSSFTNKYYCQ